MSNSEPMARPDIAPLSGLRIVDLAVGPMAATGRILAELGADVIRVEPRAGAPDRRAGATAYGVSLGFVAANMGKRSVALNLNDTDDRAEFDALIADADILIENAAPGSTAAARLDMESIRKRHPELVVLSISNFGQAGPLRDWQATGPVLHALTGELSRSGVPGRAPLLPPGDLAHDCAAPQAAYAALIAYLNRLRTGLGDHLDLSLLDAAGQALDPGYGIAGSATAGVPASKLPRGRPEARHMYPIIPCKDGFVRLCVLAPRQWQGMFEWLGKPEEFADASYRQLGTRFASKTLIPAITRFFADKTRADLEVAGQSHGVPTAAVLNLDEALTTDQISAREAFRQVEIAPGVKAPYPDGVIEVDGRRMGARSGAPPLGADQNVRFAPAPSIPQFGIATALRPLEGLRVLDFGVIVVGAEQGRLLADQGADVIKVENPDFPDGSRQGGPGALMTPTFAAGHRNKRSLGINLRDPKGKALLLNLVRETDVILSNFKAGTLQSLGLDYAALSAINPGVIVVDSSAFGSTGPWSKRMGYGPLVRASAGLTAQWRYPDEDESFSDAITVYPDHVASRIGIVGVLALLIRRLRTNRGGTVSISQAEVMLSHMAPQIAELSLRRSGAQVTPPAQAAPWGVFPCAGDDEWCVVTVRDDADWLALCGVMDRDDLASDPALAHTEGRMAARQKVDDALEQWLATRRPAEASAALQSKGVPSGAMLRVAELPDHEYYVDRAAFHKMLHPHLDSPILLEAAPVASERLVAPDQKPAPLMAEHTADIMRDHLGLDLEEIGELASSGALKWLKV